MRFISNRKRAPVELPEHPAAACSRPDHTLRQSPLLRQRLRGSPAPRFPPCISEIHMGLPTPGWRAELHRHFSVSLNSTNKCSHLIQCCEYLTFPARSPNSLQGEVHGFSMKTTEGINSSSTSCEQSAPFRGKDSGKNCSVKKKKIVLLEKSGAHFPGYSALCKDFESAASIACVPTG